MGSRWAPSCSHILSVNVLAFSSTWDLPRVRLLVPCSFTCLVTLRLGYRVPCDSRPYRVLAALAYEVLALRTSFAPLFRTSIHTLRVASRCLRIDAATPTKDLLTMCFYLRRQASGLCSTLLVDDVFSDSGWPQVDEDGFHDRLQWKKGKHMAMGPVYHIYIPVLRHDIVAHCSSNGGRCGNSPRRRSRAMNEAINTLLGDVVSIWSGVTPAPER